ncbi:MAG: hypothetical protein O7G13_09235, partial [Alphaproteobacteria bacterium]|nr:hypothetical protein [Alphaproteobacteria bacterium]
FADLEVAIDHLSVFRGRDFIWERVICAAGDIVSRGPGALRWPCWRWMMLALANSQKIRPIKT